MTGGKDRRQSPFIHAGKAVAILGGRGMLGSDLSAACERAGFDARVFDLPEFDITRVEQARQAVDAASVIINCAAYTNVDGAEKEKELAHRVNGEAVGRLGEMVRAAGKWLLHISTDFVFDGKLDRPYAETDAPNPISEYGRSKLAGEQLLVESGCSYCIMRVEWTYGLCGDNFVTKLVNRAKTNRQLKVVDDQVGSPTATTEAAQVICELLRKKPRGIFHFASSGYVSRHEMAKFLFDKLRMDVEVSPCKTSDYPSPAKRPLNSRFDCSKVAALLGRSIECWQVPLEHFLRQL